MEVVMFETNRYRTDDFYVNELIEENIKSTVPIAFMTNNLDAYQDYNNDDNSGRSFLNVAWEPVVQAPIDLTIFERYKTSVINLTNFFGVEIDALEYAATTSPYVISIPIFTTGFESDGRINGDVIRNVKKVAILRADKTYGLVIPKNLATWFFGKFRIEQAALLASFLESTTIESAVAFSQSHPGLSTGDFAFRELARKYRDVELIQFDCKPTQVLSLYARRLEQSRSVRKKVSTWPYLIAFLSLFLIALLLTRPLSQPLSHMFRAPLKYSF
jgi:hypothetical protein